MKKIIISLFLIMIFMTFINTITFVSEAIDGGFITSHYSGQDPDGETADAARIIIGSVLAVVKASGVTTAVVILMVIGIKYIMASAGDRADIKKYAVKYVIGALILFSATGLISIAQRVISSSIIVE